MGEPECFLKLREMFQSCINETLGLQIADMLQHFKGVGNVIRNSRPALATVSKRSKGKALGKS